MNVISQTYYGGKLYRWKEPCDVEVYRLASRLTGRMHWVSIPRPSDAVIAALKAAALAA